MLKLEILALPVEKGNKQKQRAYQICENEISANIFISIDNDANQLSKTMTSYYFEEFTNIWTFFF